MASVEAEYLLPGFHFMVTFPGKQYPDIDTRFQEVSGLISELETVDLKEGGENRFVHKLPVRAKYPPLVLKRAIFPVSSELLKWADRAIQDLDIEPLDIQVFLLNEEHQPIKKWLFTKAYPVKIETSALNATKNELVIESIELVYQFAKKEE